MHCFFCGDYQYSESFDSKLGRKRSCGSSEACINNIDCSNGINDDDKINSSIQSVETVTVTSDTDITVAATHETVLVVDTNQKKMIIDTDRWSTMDENTISSEVCATTPAAITSPNLSNSSTATTSNNESPCKLQKHLYKLSHSKPRGICNMGATCFMNSVLQTIIHNPVVLSSKSLLLGDTMKSSNCKKHDKDASSNDSNSTISNGCIACELRNLFIEASLDNNTNRTRPGSLIPSNLLYSVWIFAEHLTGYEQQDAHEFLIALLDGLTIHLERYHDEKSFNYSNGELITNGDNENYTGLVNEVYAGVLRSDLYCQVCNRCSTKIEPFLDVSLSLSLVSQSSSNTVSSNSNDNCSEQSQLLNVGRGSKRGAISLIDCLSQFTSIETLSELVMCDGCRKPQYCNKQLSIAQAPRVLILHLKRFDAIKKSKLSCHVSFPLKGLDMNAFYTGTGNNTTSSSNDIDTESLLYDLHSVVTHKGTLNQGHYVSYISVDDNASSSSTSDSPVANKKVWLKCDDENISEVDEYEVENIEAYLLFYIKVKL